MKVEIEAGFKPEFYRHSGWPRRGPHELPEAWLEAREKAACAPFDDSVTLGDALDRASERVSHTVSRNKNIIRGVPCLRSTRVPVYQICGMIGEGYTPKRTAKFLSISEDQVKAALKFASSLLEQ